MRTILHCDLDNFYASVEAILNPELVGKPIAVCGDPEMRHGIVLAKSEPAKKCGVRTGEPIWMARQKCPDIIIVSGRHGEYSKYAKKVREIYYRYTDLVEPFGDDECWLDVTGSLKLLKKDGKQIADEIRDVVRTELGLTISVGVSWNKTFAKLGSDYKKPDATTVVCPGKYKEIIWVNPIQNMLYVGRRSVGLFEKLGIKTIGDLARYDAEILKSHIGINAIDLINAAKGEDISEVKSFDDVRVVKSVGNGTTLPYDLTDLREIEQVIYLLSEEVAYRMRRKGVKGFTVSLSVRDSNLSWEGAQETIGYPTNSAKTILEIAGGIYKKLNISPVRSLRVAVSNLTKDTRMQLDFFDDGKEEVNDKFSEVFDKIRRKYGTKSIYYGTHHKSKFDMQFDVIDET